MDGSNLSIEIYYIIHEMHTQSVSTSGTTLLARPYWLYVVGIQDHVVAEAPTGVARSLLYVLVHSQGRTYIHYTSYFTIPFISTYNK